MVRHHPFLKSCVREIGNNRGRYIAILLIVTLGVGFFSGLRLTEPAMTATAQEYLGETEFYDFRLLSSLGFAEEDVEEFGKLPGYTAVGAYRADLLAGSAGGNEYAIRAHSLTDGVNTLILTEGRLPEAAGECVMDAKAGISFPVGSVVEVSDPAVAGKEYQVVGLVNSPLYLNFERGTTTVGNGSLSGFVYFLPVEFTAAAYSEIYLNAPLDAAAYTEEYDMALATLQPTVQALLDTRATARHESVRADAIAQVTAGQEALSVAVEEYQRQRAAFDAAVEAGILTGDAKAEQEAQLVAAGVELDAQQAALTAAEEKAAGLPAPTVYLFDRDSNVGYTCFVGDGQIVSAVSVVFPLLFLLVAVLVCMTTMTRMVDENRVQIGVLKSLGYDGSVIQAKFVSYAGSAAFLGWLGGYALGSFVVPQILWLAYGIMYDFADRLTYVFSLPLFLGCFVAAMGCACGAAFGACRAALSEKPANLILPKAPKPGKKIFLEYIKPLWRRLNFLHKVSARNVFRYKNRLFMMIVGISGCTALLIAGFGINDSISNLPEYQYGQVMSYDYAVTYRDGETDTFDSLLATPGIRDGAALCQTSADALVEDARTSLTLLSSDDETIGEYVHLRDGEATLAYPGEGEVVISCGLAEKHGLKTGDALTLMSGESDQITLRIAGVFDNYVSHYAVVSVADATALCGDATPNTAYLHTDGTVEATSVTTALGSLDGVVNLSVTADLVTRVSSSMNSVRGIVVFVVICAAALAFVVLYNLSNINIAERVREIATIKVLGFHRVEVAAYIFREILLLTVLGSLVGLPLGKLLHSFVMDKIKLDQVHFQKIVTGWSYLLAFAMTILFALIINLLMSRRLDKVDMSGSLKSVD